MKYETIKVGDTVRYKGVLYEVEIMHNGLFGIRLFETEDRHIIWVEATQLKKVLDAEEFKEKYPEE